MTVNKDKVYLDIPRTVPDKIVARFEGSFTTSASASAGLGAVSDGIYPITNTYGAKALPISRFSIDGGATYFPDFEQGNDVVVVTGVSASQIRYRWAANTSPHTVLYSTVLLSLE